MREYWRDSGRGRPARLDASARTGRGRARQVHEQLAKEYPNVAEFRNDPPTPTFQRVWQEFAALQQRLGGDPFIGRRLLRLLHEAGFREIALSVAPEVHHFGTPHYAAWLENLIGNLRGAEAKLVTADVQAACDELRALIQNPVGSTTFYWDRAAGVR